MMALPTGKYRAIVLWITRRPSGKAWDAEIVLTNTGEREQVTVFNGMAGWIAGACGLILKGDRFSPRNPDEPRATVDLTVKYNSKYKASHVHDVNRTGEKLPVDICAGGPTFEPVDF